MILFSQIMMTMQKLSQKRKRKQFHKLYVNTFKKNLLKQGFENKAQPGEEEYLNKWKVFGDVVEPYSYRLYSHYCGQTPNIIPEDIGHVHIETALNPVKYRSCYQDKNLFPLIIGKENVPRTVLCRINGGSLLDGNFKPVDGDVLNYSGGAKRLVWKPSVDSCSGQGVEMYELKNHNYEKVGGVKY